jgi:ABC-2 type transport system permease protein
MSAPRRADDPDDPDDVPVNVIAPRRSIPERIAALWRYRELLVGMVRKELKVKYKDSSLGFFWSLLNPAMYLVVFYVVFQIILGSGIPYFAIYLLSGLLVWTLFASSLGAGTGAIVNNGSLVNKVYFPREILPLAAIGANLVHFFLQSLVLLSALAVFRYGVDLSFLPLIVPALLVLLILLAGLAILLSALNVYARDLQHLLELALLAWFWMTPIVYAWHLPASQLSERGLPTGLTLLNPVTSVVITMQRAIYGTDHFVDAHGTYTQLLPDGNQLWYLRNLGIVGLVSVVVLVIGITVFGRLENNFAEEL